MKLRVVAASGPYISAYKLRMLNYHEGKLKWVSKKPFLRHFGKASASAAMERPAGGIAGAGMYTDPTEYFRDPIDRRRWMEPKRGWRNY